MYFKFVSLDFGVWFKFTNLIFLFVGILMLNFDEIEILYQSCNLQ